VRVRPSRRREQDDDEDMVEALGIGRRIYSKPAARMESMMRRREGTIVRTRFR
jgi:hypothetical protein